HAVNDAVQPALERRQQGVARDALLQRGLLERIAELRFQHPVNTADLLLFAHLQAVAHQLRLSIFAMLPRDEVALFDGALFAVAALSFEKQFHALAPALPADRADISCQVLCSLPGAVSYQPSALSFSFIQVRFTAIGRPSSRFFRHPSAPSVQPCTAKLTAD